MLIRLAVDPDGVGMSGHDAALQAKLTDDFVTAWMRYAVLFVGASDYAHSPLRQAVEGLPQALKSKWMKAAVFAQQRGLMRIGPLAWPGSFPSPSFDRLSELRHRVDVVGVSQAMAGHLGFAVNEAAKLDPTSSIELCRLDCLSTSARIQGADVIREQKKWRRGDRVDQIWAAMFRPFVAQVGLIAVVDRFCVQRLADCAGGESGIEQWLARVDASECGSSGVCVQVLSTLARGQLRAEVTRRLHDFTEGLPNGRIGTVELYLVDERAFGPVVHYRYVRFQSHHCIILDHGVEILEGQSLRRTHPYSFTYFDDALRADEGALRTKSQRCIVYSRPKPVEPRSSVELPPRRGTPAVASGAAAGRP